MWNIRLYRLRNFLTLASLPILLMTGGCDPAILANATATGLFNVVDGASSLFLGAFLQILQQSFPSADILQALLGGNSAPFFSG